MRWLLTQAEGSSAALAQARYVSKQADAAESLTVASDVFWLDASEPEPASAGAWKAAQAHRRAPEQAPANPGLQVPLRLPLR